MPARIAPPKRCPKAIKLAINAAMNANPESSATYPQFTDAQSIGMRDLLLTDSGNVHGLLARYHKPSPMRRIRSPCCARAAHGQAAEPTTNVMKARRFIGSRLSHSVKVSVMHHS